MTHDGIPYIPPRDGMIEIDEINRIHGCDQILSVRFNEAKRNYTCALPRFVPLPLARWARYNATCRQDGFNGSKIPRKGYAFGKIAKVKLV
jgi:hypothetical protein